MEIPLNDPCIGLREKEAVMDVLESGNLKAGGDYAITCEQMMQDAFGATEVLMTTSCTHALEMAALLLGVGPGDEVVIPSYTFPSTGNAFALRGADIRFCEVDTETLTMDTAHLREVVSSNTDVIVPVHYAGVAADMDEICDIADTNGATVVEDAAQGVNAKYCGEYLGTIGDLGCYSFHETKLYSAGEGGALVINDDQYVERAESILHKGTNYAKFARGEVDRYTWVDLGSSYGPSEIQSALASVQLERRNEIRQHRQTVHDFYMEHLLTLSDQGHISLPDIPDYTDPNYHLFYMLVNSEAERDRLSTHLSESGIGAASHYEPLHTSEMGKSFGYGRGDLTQTTDLASRLLRLPIYEDMNERDSKAVVEAIHSFYQ